MKKTEINKIKAYPKKLQKNESKTYRLIVARSVKHTMAQIVERESGRTMVVVVDKNTEKGTKVERAHRVGVAVAKEGLKKGVKKVIFDRNKRPYHGRVLAVAEGAREGGLEF